MRAANEFECVAIRNAVRPDLCCICAMSLNDRTYYVRRALQEERAARIASCEAARERHLELAAAYRRICRGDAVVREQHQPATGDAATRGVVELDATSRAHPKHYGMRAGVPKPIAAA